MGRRRRGRAGEEEVEEEVEEEEEAEADVELDELGIVDLGTRLALGLGVEVRVIHAMHEVKEVLESRGEVEV